MIEKGRQRNEEEEKKKKKKSEVVFGKENVKVRAQIERGFIGKREEDNDDDSGDNRIEYREESESAILTG